jgi:hypothetical protein
MPLTKDPYDRFSNVDLFSILFPMFDGSTQVICTVTSAALEDLAAPDGRHAEPTENLFKSYRPEVERIASDKYDAGHLVNGEVDVVNSDIPARDAGSS